MFSATEIGWYTVSLVSGVMTATGLLPLLPVTWWWVRIGDFPRLQLLIGYLFTLCLLIPFRDRPGAWWWAGLLSICVVIQLARIYPYLPIAAREVESAESPSEAAKLRIMSANVLQTNQQYDRLLELVNEVQPDVLVLVEVNQAWLDGLESLQQTFEHHVLRPKDNGYGMALYSTFRLESVDVKFLIRDDIPSIDATIALPSGHNVRLFAVHPNPPRPGEDTDKRDGELVLVGREVANKDQSTIVLGDLNDVGWSRSTKLFQKVSGLLDPRKGRGMYPTFSAESNIWRYPLDHLFHSDDFRLVTLRTLRNIGSDHFPLFVELSHEPAAAATQEAPDLDAGDRAEAQEAVVKGKEASAEEDESERKGL